MIIIIIAALKIYNNNNKNILSHSRNETRAKSVKLSYALFTYRDLSFKTNVP